MSFDIIYVFLYNTVHHSTPVIEQQYIDTHILPERVHLKQ